MAAAIEITPLAPEDRIRAAARVPFKTEVELRDPDGIGAVSLPSTNVSASGLFVKSHVALDEGTIVVADFRLPDGSLVSVAARVARVVIDPQHPDQSGMGLEFIHIDELDRRRLAHMRLRR